MSGTFKSSGSISINEINNFIENATNDLAITPNNNIRIGSANFGDVGQLFANLNIWQATLPNGDFVSPHRLSETYNANIADNSSTFEGLRIIPSIGRFAYSSVSPLSSSAKLSHSIICENDAQDHWIKYTAKIYDNSVGEYGEFHRDQATNLPTSPQNNFIFPESVRNQSYNLAAGVNLVLPRVDIVDLFLDDVVSYVMYEKGKVPTGSVNTFTEFTANAECWGVIFPIYPPIHDRGGLEYGNDIISATQAFDWFIWFGKLPVYPNHFRWHPYNGFGTGHVANAVSFKQDYITADSSGPGRVLVDPARKTSKTLRPSFEPIFDLPNHLILTQYQETDNDFIPEGYDKVYVQEGIVKLDNLVSIGDGLYRHDFDIAFNTNSMNLGNYSFTVDGVSPLGIRRNSSSSYSIVNTIDTTAEQTFTNKAEAINYWEEWVYNKRYHKMKNMFQDGSFLAGNFDIWRQVFVDDSSHEGDSCFWASALPYILAGHTDTDANGDYVNPYEHNELRLASSGSYSEGLRLHPVYMNMIAPKTKREIEKAIRFAERIILNTLDINVFIFEQDGNQFGSPTLASAAPFEYTTGAMGGYTKFESMFIVYDPSDFANDSAYIKDALGRTSIFNIIFHEIMHGLGVGYWNGQFGNPVLQTVNDYGSQYTGTHAYVQYDSAIVSKGLNNSNYYYSSVPIQSGGGHLAEYSKTNGTKIQPAFFNEIMTPIYNDFGQTARIVQPITAITLGFLSDIGYDVDYSQADSFSYLQYNLNNIPGQDSDSYDQIRKQNVKVCSCGRHH